VPSAALLGARPVTVGAAGVRPQRFL